MRYEFQRPITVEGKAYRAGQVIDQDDKDQAILQGCLDSCLRLGHVKEYEGRPPAGASEAGPLIDQVAAVLEPTLAEAAESRPQPSGRRRK